MIKTETIAMLHDTDVNPVIKSETDAKNGQFITYDGEVYLIANTLTGDDSYKEDVVIKAGEYLNGYLVKRWEGQKLVIDDKHISYATGKTYADITEGTILKIKSTGELEVAAAAPTDGSIYFVVKNKCRLTGNAVKAKVCISAVAAG